MNSQHLSKITDLSATDIQNILDLAFGYKHKFDLGIRKEEILAGKTVAMIFEKPSLRTKVSFEIATQYLGGMAVFLSSAQILASGGHEQGRESVPDIARNLARFSDLIIARVYSHDTITNIAEHVHIPVINALCDQHHPSQALADLMTIAWHKKDVADLKIAYIGDGNNVATSLMQIAAIMGLNFSIASPAGYEIPAHEMTVAHDLAKDSGSKIDCTDDPYQAVAEADVIYTDTFISMGEEHLKAQKLQEFEAFQVDMKLLKSAKDSAMFMHCLPAHRGEEVTDEVMDCEQSVVFDQAECRMNIAKALLTTYLK